MLYIKKMIQSTFKLCWTLIRSAQLPVLTPAECSLNVSHRFLWVKQQRSDCQTHEGNERVIMFHLLYVHQKPCFSCLHHSHPPSALRFHHCWVFIQSSICIYSTHKVSLHITGSCITHERHKTPLIAFVITYLDYSFPRSRSECKHCHLMTGLWSTRYTIRSINIHSHFYLQLCLPFYF